MPWDTKLYGLLQHRSKTTAKSDWFRWIYGEEIGECVNSVFTRESYPNEDEESLENRRINWASLLRRFQKYGHHSTGNRVTVLEGGDACFTAMLAAIAAAQTRVWCESYIFDNSRIGETFFKALRDAALRGCDVVLLIDYIGSFTLRHEWMEELNRAGADVVVFNPVLPPGRAVGPASFRDHRKITICDEAGFCGGMNIHEEVGEELYGTSRFYDVHAMLEGPCVADLAEVFCDSLRESNSRVARSGFPPPRRIEPGIYVQILQSNVRQRRRSLQKVITQSIESAEEAVFLTTAYFFPPGFLRRALVRAPSRGVSLSLLLSGSSDFYPIPGDLLAQRHFLRRFLRATAESGGGDGGRVTVHLYDRRHMHAKHMVVDGVFSTIGSFNFDLYSARRNLEVGLSVFDRGVAQRLQELHERRVGEAKRTTFSEATYHNPFERTACAIAYCCVRLSGRNLFDGLDIFRRKWLVRKAALTFLLEEQAAQFIATSMMWGLE